MTNDEKLNALYQTCEPTMPATEEQYGDTTAARGSGVLTAQVCRHLERSRAGQHRCFLFAGHRGCGKSTELHHLSHVLQRQAHAPYFPVLVDASSYATPVAIDCTDILLAISCEIAVQLRQKTSADLSGALDAFLDKTLSTPIMGRDPQGQAIGEQLLEIKARLSRILKDRASKQPYLAGIEQRLDDSRQALLFLVDEAQHALQEKKQGELLIIVDNLDSIISLDRERDAYKLFIEESGWLRGLGAHVIYTAPLLFARKHKGTLRSAGYQDTFVLPMVKVYQRPRHGGWEKPYEDGVRSMTEVLRLRLSRSGLTVEEVISAEALAQLIRYSGGSIREFLIMLQQCTVVDEARCPLGPRTARAVIGKLRADILVPERYWPKLAHLDLAEVDGNARLLDDADYQDMLIGQYMLEYVNGSPPEASDDGDADDEDDEGHYKAWYATNPLLRRRSEYRAAQRSAGS